MNFIIIILAIIGLMDSLFLMYETKYTEGPLICPLNFDCSSALESQYSKFYGIRNEHLGFVYYLGITLISLGIYFLPGYSELLVKLLLLGTGIGFIYTLYLLYIQITKLKNYCLYCLISAASAILLFATSFITYI